MRNRLALSLFAGCAALLTAGGAGAQAPSPAVQAIPVSTPEAPRDADGNLMIGKPFVACGPTTGSQIGILPNSVRNTSAQNAAATTGAGATSSTSAAWTFADTMTGLGLPCVTTLVPGGSWMSLT